MQQADKDSASLKRALAAALIKAGEAALSMQNFKEARSVFAESFALRLDLAEAVPGAAEPARDLAVALERLGLVARAEGDLEGARAAWEQELALIEHIHADDDPAGLRFGAITEMLLAGLNGLDAEARRQSARVRMAQLETLAPLTMEDAALIERLKAPN
jgi:tetratricopeptide (TPR) repeat protein